MKKKKVEVSYNHVRICMNEDFFFHLEKRQIWAVKMFCLGTEELRTYKVLKRKRRTLHNLLILNALT